MAIPLLGEQPYRPGQRVIKRGVYLYGCPTCGARYRFDDKYGPACTGPGAQDVHPMIIMDLLEVTEPLTFFNVASNRKEH